FSFDGSTTRNAFADFLIGKPISLDQASPYERLVRGYDWYAFVQDDIRVSRKLTMNLGLRYQFFRPYHNMYDRANTFHAGQKSTVVPRRRRTSSSPEIKAFPAVSSALTATISRLASGWRGMRSGMAGSASAQPTASTTRTIVPIFGPTPQ